MQQATSGCSRYLSLHVIAIAALHERLQYFNTIINDAINNGSEERMMPTEDCNLSWSGAKACLTGLNMLEHVSR